jgi:lysozyme
MDLIKLRKQLEIDEGVIYKVYKDHLGYKTFGIGHLIRNTDYEYGQPVGTLVSKERVRAVFEKDIATVIKDCEKLYPDFYSKPEEVQQIIANMMFNLGLTKLSKFKATKRAIDSENWTQAAIQMRNSLWYRQVTKRAERLAKRMENVKSKPKAEPISKKIIEIPRYNEMIILECDECKQTALNLYMDKNATCLAYRCIACNNAGYFHIDLGEDDEI